VDYIQFANHFGPFSRCAISRFRSIIRAGDVIEERTRFFVSMLAFDLLGLVRGGNICRPISFLNRSQ
jgi:hypothetical protein